MSKLKIALIVLIVLALVAGAFVAYNVIKNIEPEIVEVEVEVQVIKEIEVPKIIYKDKIIIDQESINKIQIEVDKTEDRVKDLLIQLDSRINSYNNLSIRYGSMEDKYCATLTGKRDTSCPDVTLESLGDDEAKFIRLDSGRVEVRIENRGTFQIRFRGDRDNVLGNR